MAHELRISVLGGFEVALDGRPVEPSAWPRNRARAVVKLLALAVGHRLHREQVIEVLWPDLGHDAGSGNLRKAIHFARRAIGADHLRFAHEVVSLEAPSLVVDVDGFEAAVAAGRRADALAAYRGDLLPDDRFEAWAEDPRERLRMRFHRLLLEAASEQEDAGRLDAAATTLERLAESDPLNEEACLRLVRVLARAGSRHLALARYRELEQRLRNELDAAPEPALRELAANVASGLFPAAAAGPGRAPTDPGRMVERGRTAATERRSAETPFVGRDHELRAIVALFEQSVADRTPRLVELSGAAGVGKSRLAREVIDRVGGGPWSTTVLRGRCLPDERGGPFGALGEILREACGIRVGGGAAEARRLLRHGLQTILADLDPADREPTIFALALSAGIALPSNPLERLSPSEAFDRVALAWPILASAQASAGPTILFLEDVHWARPELLELVERIVTRSHGPLLVLVTARPEAGDRRSGFAAHDASRFVLQPLADEPSQALVDHLLRDSPIEARVRADILARAEGNPFFIEQLSHHLRSGSAAGLPDTLQTLLSARLDALPAVERRVLQEASVVGRTFWEAPLALALPGERVTARLASLERKGFVVRHGTSSLPGQSEYSIRHALIQDATYASLSRARRTRAHVATADWLEDIAGDRVEELVELLAHHFWAALSAKAPQLGPSDGIDVETIRAKAFEYAMRAGDASRTRFVTDTARELHTRALTLAAGTEERLAAMEALGRDHEDEFHGDLATGRFLEALELARADGSPPGARARLCRRLAWLMAWNPGAFRANPDAAVAETLVDEGMAHVGRGAEGERAWLSLARAACARLYRGSEPFGQGIDADPLPIATRLAAAEGAMATARRLGMDELAVAAENVLGMLYGLASHYPEMVALARRQVADLRPDQSRLDQSDAIRKLATHLINVEADFEQGLELGRRCRQLLGATGAGGPHQVMHTLWPILASLFFLGRWDELLEPLAEHVEAFRVEPARECQFVRDGPAIGAAALTLLGRLDEAAATAGLLGDPLAERESASAWQARLALFQGDPATARAISRDKALQGRIYGPQHACVLLDALVGLRDPEAVTASLPFARDAAAGNAMLPPTADRAEGWLQLQRGERAAAARLLRSAAHGFETRRVPFEQARTLHLLAEATAASEAQEALERAAAIERRLGVQADAAAWLSPLPARRG